MYNIIFIMLKIVFHKDKYLAVEIAAIILNKDANKLYF